MISNSNLYGYALSEPMAYKDYEWMDYSEYSKINWNGLCDKSEIGYILEVDLYYPHSLHDAHSELPLCPIKRTISEHELSRYQKTLVEYLKSININYRPSQKLILDLNHKNNYVLHYMNLKLYLELGLKLGKIHRVLKFKQKNYISPYIQLNTKLREKANDKFTQDLLKLFNNAIFGKSCQNVRTHIDVKFVINEKQVKNYLKKPLYESFRIIDEKKALIRMKKSSVLLNRPIIIGFSVLDISKKLMYDLFYNVFKRKFGEKIKLIYCDTDSLVMLHFCNDIFDEIKKISNVLDLSNYPVGHFLFNEKNKKKLGYLKDESAGKLIKEFIALKSKLYSYEYVDGLNIKRAKGLQNVVLKNFINHYHYKDCLEFEDILEVENRRVGAKNLEISTIKTNKISHTPYDDKRYLCNDKINSLPFGHYKLDY